MTINIVRDKKKTRKYAMRIAGCLAFSDLKGDENPVEGSRHTLSVAWLGLA